MQRFFADSLSRMGHEVVGVAENGQQLLDDFHDQQPDLVVTDIRMPEMDGLEAARRIYQQRPVPIVVVSAYHTDDYVDRAEQNHVLAYLVKPIKEAHLGPAISIAMRRFAEFQELRQETDDLRQALEDRKLIERAKGIIMKQADMDEPGAFRRLQKLARDNSQKLVDVARMIVVAAGALAPAEEDE